MWKNVFYLKKISGGWITSAHGLFQMAFNFAWECVFLIGVSEGELVRARACRWSCGWLHPIPQYSSCSLPCLENPIMEGGRARLEGWAGSTSVWMERGAGFSPNPENRACRPGPSCSDRPLSVGALWHTTEPAQATVSDDSFSYTSCKKGFYWREDVNHSALWVWIVFRYCSP